MVDDGPMRPRNVLNGDCAVAMYYPAATPIQAEP